MLSWYEKPLRILDFIPPAPEKYESINLKEQFSIRKNLGFNAEHVEVHDITVGEAAITYYPSDFSVETRRNILKEICESYDKLGLFPIVYFNVHWLSPSLSDREPDWLQRNNREEVIPSAYGAGGYSCVNSAFREYAFGTLRTLAGYNIRGVFLDGPVFRIEGCYCEGCQNRFLQTYGYPMAQAAEKTLFDFKRHSVARFMKDCRDVLKKHKPDALIYMNSPQLIPTKYCGRDNRLTVEFQDMLLAEGGFLGGNLREIPIWKPAATAQLLETQARGKPYCVAIAGRHSPWSRYLLPDAETWIVHAMACAHGANTWYGIYNDNNRDPRMDTVRKVNLFLKQNEAYYTKTESVADIALLWSYATANNYQSSAEETDFTDEQSELSEKTKGDASSSFKGWFDALSRSRILFNVIDEVALTDGSLDKYKLLILPNTSCLSGSEAQSVEKFVEKGGNLISSFDTSFYDETGSPRFEPLLKNVMGIERLESIQALSYDHISVDSEEPLFNGIDQSFIPAASLGIYTHPGAKAKPVAFFRKKQASRYCELPDPLPHPYIIENHFGAGKSIYFAGNVDSFYWEHALSDYRQLMSNTVRSLVPDLVTVAVRPKSESIHLSLRKQKNRMILHLINYTASMSRPISEVLPVEEIKICLHNIQGHVKEIKGLQINEKVPFHLENQELNFKVPKLKEYEVMVVEMDG